MLCAYLWWMVEGKALLRIPVSSDDELCAHVPPMPFGCPVSVQHADSVDENDDDPEVSDDEQADDDSFTSSNDESVGENG